MDDETDSNSSASEPEIKLPQAQISGEAYCIFRNEIYSQSNFSRDSRDPFAPPEQPSVLMLCSNTKAHLTLSQELVTCSPNQKRELEQTVKSKILNDVIRTFTGPGARCIVDQIIDYPKSSFGTSVIKADSAVSISLAALGSVTSPPWATLWRIMLKVLTFLFHTLPSNHSRILVARRLPTSLYDQAHYEPWFSDCARCELER
ncbi:hypothetical protein PFICI_06459 [Pestalotiopsis fici W106-1]|uniref:Uncharacterized protein n=1 Tax=Pestalotiopsis fici (strain W106-1 / CGMCC3.15140) TaxID=1229662 RepID=W3X7T6_PESFW|nr:uncharacterized protein PFICI_06459 [Pestalotiopsis fici W106-1]ETS81457.1 hypothetical protein PFICI_06459 [Pestalotiopsis fici W106-1]